MKPHVYKVRAFALGLMAGVFFFPQVCASPASGVQDTLTIFNPVTVLDLSGQPIYVIDFIESLRPLAVEEMKKHHIPASVTLAQAILESGYGQSLLAQNAGNYFGIKANRWEHETYLHNGDYYRSYNNLYAAIEDHSKFLLEKPVFQNLVKRNDYIYTSWLYGLEATGYAEDEFYVAKLREIIERFALYRLDELVPQSSALETDAL